MTLRHLVTAMRRDPAFASLTTHRAEELRVVAPTALQPIIAATLADDRLVQQDVIEHRPQRVLGVIALYCEFDRLGNGYTQAAGVVRRFLQHRAAKNGLH